MKFDVYSKAEYTGWNEAEQDWDYAIQNGNIFAWSESNLNYELAWWLDENGKPIDDSEHVRNILAKMPYDTTKSKIETI